MINLPAEHAYFLRNSDAKRVLSLIGDAGGRAFFVGGCVRNAVMNMSSPDDDIDIATNLPPESVIQCAKNNDIPYLTIGIDHGTITWIINQKPYEITTFRNDILTDGRHAVVRFSDNIYDDAVRRDFTMNAIYCGIWGKLRDPVGGIYDASDKNVKFIGNVCDRITQDYLRILRYFRFVSLYGIPDDFDAVCDIIYGMKNTIKRPSGERNINELKKILMGKNAVAVIQKMLDIDIFKIFFNVDNVYIKKYIDYKSVISPSIYPPHYDMAVLCGDAILNVPEMFRLSRTEMRDIKTILNMADIINNIINDAECPYHIINMRYDISDDILHTALIMSNKNNMINTIMNVKLPDFHVTGNDLLRQNIPAPLIGQTLKSMRLNQLKDLLFDLK